MKKGPWLPSRSLSRQLLLGFGLSLTTVGLATLGVNYWLIRANLAQQVQERAKAVTQSLEFSTEGLLELENRSILRRVVQNFATLPAIAEIVIVNPDGLIMAHSGLDAKHTAYKTIRPTLATAMEHASATGLEISQELVLNGKPMLAQIHPFSSTIFGNAGKRGLTIAIVDLKQMQNGAAKTFLASTLTLLTGIVIILILMGSQIRQKVLRPLRALNDEVAFSTRTGVFSMPPKLPNNEIRFLATTFDTVIKQLEAYDQLKAEITQRKQVEAELRDREASERKKSQELAETLQELKQAQIRLVQSEKMSGLGQLVAGVAHEINNPVNFIHGNLHHANQYLQDLLELVHLYQDQYPNAPATIQEQAEAIDLAFVQEDLPRLLASMQVGADRIREIVQSLRTFSRLDEAEVKSVDIHAGIDSTLMILQNRLKAKPDHPEIQVIRNYGNLPKIECYAGQLNQVFMNVLSNAIDALEESSQFSGLSSKLTDDSTQNSLRFDSGRTKLKTQNSPTIQIHTEVIGDRSVQICIADNGPGMSEAVQKRLFDPFFTTKPVGKGTGLGLSISHQVVTERHGGRLHCVSALGQGTEFAIEIPIQQEQR